MKSLEIMDTTLRDGEQTPNVAYSPAEKLQIAKILLKKVCVDRIEVASARVSEGEKEGAGKIIAWAKTIGKVDAVEILGFTDGGKSIDWIKSIDGRVINLLTKGSETHCRGQLRKTPQEHYDLVCKDIDYAKTQDMSVNVYLEDWSGGMRDNEDYVFNFTEQLLKKDNVKRIMLADTLGIANSANLHSWFNKMQSKFPTAKFDFHGHNDYGLATGNAFQAAIDGIEGIHTTVNNLGERAGNSSLCEVVATINDMTDREISANEKHLVYISEMVEAASGKRIAANSPIVGSDVYTQTCGVHADGDKKGNLYANPLTPERFARSRSYALGKLSGKASIDKNLELLGIELDVDDRDKILAEVIKLGDKKEKVTTEDLPFIISDILKTINKDDLVEIVDYEIVSKKTASPLAKISVKYNDEIINSESEGDGGYDAFMKAIRIAFNKKNIELPSLVDYEVRIPPGGKTDALVETTIIWESKDNKSFTTNGLDSDQIEAAIKATIKMLNIIIK